MRRKSRGDCRRAKRWFDARGLSYVSIDSDHDPLVEAFVMRINHGMIRVPTILFPDGLVRVEPGACELEALCLPKGEASGKRKEKSETMNNEMTHTPKDISHPRFAAFYTWLMKQTAVRRAFMPLRREIAGQAYGIVLEVGAGGGQNFPVYDPTRVERVEAVEPDEAMLAEARRNLATAPVPIAFTRAPVEELPFPDASFDSVVVALVFCSVSDPKRGLREIWRVLKPGGSVLLLEHVRAQGKIAAWVQDALVPVTTFCLGNCHWNRDTEALVVDAGFGVTRVQKQGGVSSPSFSCRRHGVPRLSQCHPRSHMNVSDCAQPQQESAALHHEELIVVGARQAGLVMG